MTIEDGISAFMLSRKAAQVSKKTVLYYKWCLGIFESYLTQKNICELEQIKPNTIREYLVYSQGRLKATSVRTYFRSLRAFFNFLSSEQYMENNPIAIVKMPVGEQKIPRTFSAKEIKAILNAFNQTDFLGYRNYTIMSMLFATGLRRQELLELKFQDINFDIDMVRVSCGKGRKERFVPLGRSMRKILLTYLRYRKEFLDERYNEYLWVNVRGENLHANGLQAIFAKLKIALDIKQERFSPHSWRHTFAKNYLLNGGDIFSLQKILGHSDIATTRIYLNLNQDEVKTQFAKYNPHDCREWAI